MKPAAGLPGTFSPPATARPSFFYIINVAADAAGKRLFLPAIPEDYGCNGRGTIPFFIRTAYKEFKS